MVFERLVGVRADAKELEYISALHQTGVRLRPNGSIRDEDIKTYLRSRFGIEVSLEDVRQTILQGLGGSDGEDEVIDLVELTAIILIPLLLKASVLEKGQELPPKCVPPPKHLLEMGVKIILHDVAGDVDAHQKLSPGFVKRMLRVYGENEMAEDEILIQEMIQAANGFTHDHSTTSSTPSSTERDFDVFAFAEALTRDVQLYDLENEVRLSTSIEDVFEKHKASSTDDQNLDDQEPQSGNGRQIENLKHIYTAPAIDIQAGTYRSKALTLSLWGSVLFGTFKTAIDWKSWYGGKISCGSDYIPEEGWSSNNAQALRCDAYFALEYWAILFCIFALLGMLLMGLGSVGNYHGHDRWYLPLFGAGWCCTYYYFFLLTGVFADGLSQYEWKNTQYLYYISVLAQMLTGLTALLHLCSFISIIFRGRVDFENSKWWILRLLGGAPKIELHVKTAGAHKTAQLMSNAILLMQNEGSCSAFRTYFGLGLSAFIEKRVSRKESGGGFFWLLRGLRDQSIFEKEGIWYSTRLLASNCAQVVLSLFIVLLGYNAIRGVRANFGAEQAVAQMNEVLEYMMNTTLTANQTQSITSELAEVYVELICVSEGFSDFGNCTDYFNELVAYYGDNITGQIQEQLQSAISAPVEALYPEEEYMVVVPLWIAVVVAFMAALRLAMLYLPGVTTTILELRSGVIPSLHSPDFERYRFAPDTVTMLTGSLFWGCLVSSILFGLVIGFVVFLFLWQGSRYFMIRLLALVVSAILVVIVRLLFVVFCCRKRFYKGLYRTRPAAANISMLALEWANFVFTSAFILLRMLKLILIAVVSIGQIDRRILANGVGQFGRLEFDPFPTIHLRDVVAHEAHRHPYIEILGTMYLMKLRYAKSFANRAGSAWRLIFVYALLPWMHQYRISGEGSTKDSEFSEVDQDCEQTDISIIDEENTIATGSKSLLPALSKSKLLASSVDMNALEIENLKLKQVVERLRYQLGEIDQVHDEDGDL